MFLKITQKSSSNYSMIEISEINNVPTKIASKEDFQELLKHSEGVDTFYGELPTDYTKPFKVAKITVVKVHSKKEHEILMLDSHEGFVVADNSKTIEAIRLK